MVSPQSRSAPAEQAVSPFVVAVDSDAAMLESKLHLSFDEIFSVDDAPPRLRKAAELALLSGGKRIRPRLCMTVARSCEGFARDLALDYASALELAHAASLVHDDLPAFDDAATRRGRATTHVVFGEATAILVGDALLTGAFDVLGRTERHDRARVGTAVRILARALGGSAGIIAGQAWESEPEIDLERYHRAKTAALFEASACLGALAGGCNPDDFRAFGDRVGLAYQVADDLIDLTATAAVAGKPVARDAVLGRPNAAHALGETMARAKLDRLLEEARDVLPAYADRTRLGAWLSSIAASLQGR